MGGGLVCAFVLHRAIIGMLLVLRQAQYGGALWSEAKSHMAKWRSVRRVERAPKLGPMGWPLLYDRQCRLVGQFMCCRQRLTRSVKT